MTKFKMGKNYTKFKIGKNSIKHKIGKNNQHKMFKITYNF